MANYAKFCELLANKEQEPIKKFIQKADAAEVNLI